ncbi:phosphoribosylpyrophosphate synthetase [Hymenobacter persicinus]|uniref:Phosphoribosylpyrophosphate synthetase n=1 Tax=Hymenobacter persicinus TaxID=2025506 RepID=A0A4Q5LD55_9BACT|nr:phosphoribosylpyrophosphate synthetase [Hymenobacter persicinus]RYU79712.1 phosphoribosylpyrophosphate synthetase [Hymenobacter persicinus]
MSQPSYDTLTQAVRALQQRGYTDDFNIQDGHLHHPGLAMRLHPQQFQVREFYRFEGETDPGDESVVYAIESDQGVKGLLVSAYGAYSEPLNDELMHKLNMPRA